MKVEELRERFLAQWDNPTAEHDARAILSAFKVAIWLTIFNLVVIAFIFADLGWLANLPQFQQTIEKRGVGHLLLVTLHYAVACFFTLILPLRAAGLLDGPRRSGYLDQVVSTGISPLRFFLGRYLSSMAFVLVFLIASLPYTILFSVLGLGGWTQVPLLAFELLVYANFLVLVTLALGTLINEYAGAALVLIACFTFDIVDMSGLENTIPFPIHFGGVGPFRLMFATFFEELAKGGSKAQWAFVDGAPVFGMVLSIEAFKLGLWLACSVFALGAIAVGPRHFFERGLNNFDNVVLAGDMQRAMVFRLRPLLNRRVQLAFFYENRADWIKRHDLIIRAGIRLLAFTLLLVLGLGGLLSAGGLASQQNAGSVFGILMSVWMVVAYGNMISTLRIRSDFCPRWSNRASAPFDVVTFDTFIAIGLAFFATLLVVFGLWLYGSVISGLAFDGRPSDAGQLELMCLEWIGITTLYILSVQFAAKLMGLTNLSRPVVLVFMILYLIVSLAGPLLVGAFFSSIAQPLGSREEPSPVLTQLASLAHLSPLARLIVSFASSDRKPFGDTFLGHYGFWVFYPIWVVGLGTFLRSWVRARQDEYADLLAGPAPLPEPLGDPGGGIEVRQDGEAVAAELPPQDAKAKGAEAKGEDAQDTEDESGPEDGLADEAAEDAAEDQTEDVPAPASPDAPTVAIETKSGEEGQ